MFRSIPIVPMFTIIVLFGLAAVLWWWSRSENKEVLGTFDDTRARQTAVFDLKLIAFLLMAILLMLGTIADLILGVFDRMH